MDRNKLLQEAIQESNALYTKKKDLTKQLEETSVQLNRAERRVLTLQVLPEFYCMICQTRCYSCEYHGMSHMFKCKDCKTLTCYCHSDAWIATNLIGPSHGLCEPCYRTQYPEIYDKTNQGKQDNKQVSNYSNTALFFSLHRFCSPFSWFGCPHGQGDSQQRPGRTGHCPKKGPFFQRPLPCLQSQPP